MRGFHSTPCGSGRIKHLAARNGREPSFPAKDVQIVDHLGVDPELRRCSKILRQPVGGIRGNGPRPVDNLVDPTSRDSNVFGESVLGNPERFQELFGEDLAGSHKR